MMTPSELDLDVLMDSWRGPLIGLAISWGVRHGDAIELAQDTFAEAWVGRSSFRGDASDTRSVGGWLAGIARNLHRVSVRKLRPEELAPGAADSQPAPEPSPEQERARHLIAVILSLPDREREVVQAFYFGETSTVHVAALLDLTPRAVEGLLRRARERLRSSLNESQGFG